MSQRSYNNVLKRYRKKFLELEIIQEKRASNLVDKFAEKLSQAIFDHAKNDGTLNVDLITDLEREIDSISKWYQEQLKDTTKDGLRKSARIAMDGQDAAAVKHMTELIEKNEENPKLQALFRKALSDPNPMLLSATYGDGLPDAIADQVWDYRWKDGHRLSDRIWKQGEQVRSNLHGMIQQSVNEGRSAVELSRATEEYLKLPGPAWTTGIKPSVTGRGSIKYNALRLARTENNQAYHRAQSISAKRSELIKGEKWNLSMSHPIDWPPSAAVSGYPEICDYWAEEDHVGLGPGVFHPGEAPFDHPNGLCYKTNILLNNEELKDLLEEKYGTVTGETPAKDVTD